MVPLLVRDVRTVRSITIGAALCVAASIIAWLMILVIPIYGDRPYYEATYGVRYEISDKPRIENLKQAPTIVTERTPFLILLGSGSGAYESASVDHFPSHNTYLRVLYEQGVVGLLLFVFFLGFVFMSALRKAQRGSVLHALLVASLVAIVIQSFFVDSLHWRHFFVLLGLISSDLFYGTSHVRQIPHTDTA